MERQLLEDVVDELDRRLLAELVVDPQDPETGAVVDRGELVVLLAGALERGDELHVDLDLVSRLGLLVALPALAVAHVALRRRQAAKAQTPQDPPDPGLAEREVVVALQVHRDLQRAEVVVLTQIDDLADDIGAGGSRAATRPRRAVAQAGITELRVAPLPAVKAGPRDAVVAAGQRDVAGDFLGVPEDRQAVGHGAQVLSFDHWDLLLIWETPVSTTSVSLRASSREARPSRRRCPRPCCRRA